MECTSTLMVFSDNIRSFGERSMNRSGFIGVLAAIFIGLFAFVYGAVVARKVQRYEDAQNIVIPLAP